LSFDQNLRANVCEKKRYASMQQKCAPKFFFMSISQYAEFVQERGGYSLVTVIQKQGSRQSLQKKARYASSQQKCAP
jgi:hypothetical protein